MSYDEDCQEQLCLFTLQREFFPEEASKQIVINDINRTRLSRPRMIWLLPPPPKLSSVSVSSAEKTEKHRQLADRRGGGGGANSYGGEKAWFSVIHLIISGVHPPSHLVIYKSYNNLCQQESGLTSMYCIFFGSCVICGKKVMLVLSI
jgi:hypothetical protein